MRPFQLLRNVSQFWSTTETAGPTTWDVLRFWDHPRPLRPVARSRPSPFGLWTAPDRASVADAHALTTFWRTYYGGEDWTYEPEADWVASQLKDSNTIALVVRNQQAGAIVGSIVCRSLTGPAGYFRLGTHGLANAYIIEGLCIHPDWRGKHLAGWLIAWIDHLANQNGPQAFFWSREALPKDITYVASHQYGYVRLRDLSTGPQLSARADNDTMEVDWATFRRIWTSYIQRWDTLGEAAFPTSLPEDPLRVWRCGSHYVVVSDTRRRVRQWGGKVWEVQFCGDLYEPTRQQGDARRMLEVVGSLLAAEGDGLLFVGSAPWLGGCVSSWPRPWIVGTAGVHTTYIYNYMPPVFHRLATLFLRNEM